MRRLITPLVVLCHVAWVSLPACAQVPSPNAPDSALQTRESPLQKYIAARVEDIERRNARDFENPAGWMERAPALRRELFTMLGLDPMPPKGALHPVVTGRLEHAEFTVEKLHFQSLPGLYVTGNLYIPKKREGRLPAVLYVCGHSVMREGKTSFGNKTGYQHHPAWFARNGFVCLAIDTIQLGEIPGLHHGTHHLNHWWWNSRGYTPAGVETWNGIRALDYLCTREEVDPQRLGVTGRSGGGAYSWYIAAADERVKAAVPVAGITDLRNHLLDGVVDGHCDCMFLLNTKKWDFAKLAALVAPRPLLISNTDKDPIFPVDGVERIHRDVAVIYKALGAKDKLGLLITEGPHVDNQELQAPAFRWFKRFLANVPDYPAPLAEKIFAPSDLRVLGALPADERTSSTHAWFVPAAEPSSVPVTEALRTTVFPHASGAKVAWSVVTEQEVAGRKIVLLRAAREAFDLPETQPVLVLKGAPGVLNGVVDALSGKASVVQPGMASLRLRMGEGTAARAWMESGDGPATGANSVEGLIIPRGLEVHGPRAFHQAPWSVSEKDATRIRRRFMLLGETLDSVRVRDLVSMLEGLAGVVKGGITVSADGTHAVNAALAALLTASPVALHLSSLPENLSQSPAPDHFNLLRVTDLSGILEAAKARAEVRISP